MEKQKVGTVPTISQQPHNFGHAASLTNRPSFASQIDDEAGRDSQVERSKPGSMPTTVLLRIMQFEP
jgi:hypothetical protein